MEYRLTTCANPWRKHLRNDGLTALRSKKLHHVPVYQHQFETGRALTQILRLDTVKIWWYDITISKPCKLEVYPYECGFSLHFGIRNNLAIPFDTGHTVLREGEIQFLYMRNLISEITFEPGRYIFCQVDYNSSWLTVAGDQHPSLSEAISNAERSLGCAVQKNCIPISIEARGILQTIFTEGSPPKRNTAQDAAHRLLTFILKSAEF